MHLEVDEKVTVFLWNVVYSASNGYITRRNHQYHRTRYDSNNQQDDEISFPSNSNFSSSITLITALNPSVYPLPP